MPVNLQGVDFYDTEVTSAASAWPIDATEAKTHMRVDYSDTDNDAYILTLIKAATNVMENHCRRTFINTTRTLKLPNFPLTSRRPLLLPYSPVSSITSIGYVDGNGDDQTWSSAEYSFINSTEPEYVLPAYSKVYPSTREVPEAVTITFVAGYGAAGSNMPPGLVHTVKLFVAELYQTREPVELGIIGREMPLSYKYMLMPYVVPLI